MGVVALNTFQFGAEKYNVSNRAGVEFRTVPFDKKPSGHQESLFT